jgi:4-amino-4-deoxy-L-arabinose transferase-like glycosyltransferase
VTQPTPAIVPQSAVRRLPRVALWLFCVAYVLPGLFGREPWKGNEFTAFGHMLALAEGTSDWLNPSAWGQAPELDALLPYWLGAWAIQLAPSWLSAGLAARIPFALLLGLTLATTWHGVYYLALSPQAQPVPFAFGGEAKPKDYARTIADGAVLALIACLGLTLLSHEASPILTQLAFVSCAFYGIAALPYHPRYSLTALSTGLVGLCLSGAPSFAVLMAIGSGLLCLLDRQSTTAKTGRLHALLLLSMGAVVTSLATILDVWHWRLLPIHNDWQEWRSLLRLLAWFTWPAWPLAAWTLWRWRRQWTSLHWSRHLVLPMWFTGLIVITAMLTRSADQTLLLALPSFATLAAFALPTLRRSVAALIDWFTLIFFSGCAFVIWVIWIAMQTGWPAQPAANVKRLFPGFEPSFSWFTLVVASAATAVWIWLVMWRTSKHRHALWKSMVLPAGGAALCWLLLLTLWVPLLDFARSYKPWVEQIQAVMSKQDAKVSKNVCVLSYGLDVGQMTAFHYHGDFDIKAIDITPVELQRNCTWLLVDNDLRPGLGAVVQLSEWTRVRTIRRPSDNNEDVTLYYRRQP